MNASRSRTEARTTTRPDASDVALVICGHGSHLNPDSSAPVYDHAARIRDRGIFAEVREAFWKEEPSLRNALRTVEATEVVVVPLFVSEGYFTDEVIPRELRLGDRSASGGDSRNDEDNRNGEDGWNGENSTVGDVDDESALDVAKRVRYTDPVGTHRSMTDVIVARAERITDDPEVGPGTGLAVIGHGTERNPTSARATREHAASIRERGRFDDVAALFMDQSPFVDDVLDHFGTERIVAVPLFIANGFHTREEIPDLLGLAGEYPSYENPSDVDGREIHYAGAVGTEPSFSEVIEERAREALSRPPDADGRPQDATGSSDRSTDMGATGDETETESEAAAAREAFVACVDREIETDGASSWGELLVTVVGDDADADGSASDDQRTYELRHRADAGASPAALDTHTDPHRAREIARFDDAGEYRPLKSAPTLASGWRLAGLDAKALHRAISFFYPASIENWYREQEDRLDVTDYAETAARQTGMYDPVDELEGKALDRAVQACCTDDVCLKRRVWEASQTASDGADGGDAENTEGTGDVDDIGGDGQGRTIDAPPGNGAFPCREPCSLFVAAAREFVLADRRDGETGAREDASNGIGSIENTGSTERPELTDADREDLDGILTALADDPDGVTPVRDGDVSEPTNRYRLRYLREKLRDLGRERPDGDSIPIGSVDPVEQAGSDDPDPGGNGS